MNKKRFTVAFLTMLISPLLSLYITIKGVKGGYKKWLLVLLVTIFGSNFIVIESGDTFRHIQPVYEYYYGLSSKEYFHGVKQIISLDPLPQTNDDLYIHTLSFFCGSILRAPQLFLTIVAFIYGFFYVSGLLRVYKYKTFHKRSVLLISISLLFISILFIDSMQTVRTWTGAWVLFNGIFGYLESGKKKYLILILITPAIHIAYLVMAVPAVGVFFQKFFDPKILLVLYVLSFGMIGFNSQTIVGQLNSNEVGASKVNAYYQDPNGINANNSREINDQKNWYAKYGKRKSKRYGCNALILTFALLGLFSKRKMNRLEFNLFAIGILFMIWSNLFHFIPAVSGRTMGNAVIYITAAVALFFFRGAFYRVNNKGFLNKNLLLASSLAFFIPHFIYRASNTIAYASAGNVAFPVLYWIYPEANFSIRELLGWLLYPIG